MKINKLLLLFFMISLLVTIRCQDDDEEEEYDNNDENEGDEGDEGADDSGSGDDDDEDIEFTYPAGKEPIYSPLVPAYDVFYVETFQDEPFNSGRWVKSHVQRYLDQDWRWGYGKVRPAIPGDKGVFYGSANKHYAAGTFFQQPINNTDKTLVIQYEARFQNSLECGGAYIKILSTNITDIRKFGSNSPYIIMFGPDKCGDTDKIHLIIRHKNKISGKFQEKHLVEPPKIPDDNRTHLYTLAIHPTNKYSILIDGESVKEGSLFTDFLPPFQPPKTIDDKTDKKPDDWDDREEIPDPNDKKPDDWDSEPETIPDPDAVKPDDWLEDEPEYVPDESVEKPDDWDDDSDGVWERPEVYIFKYL